MSNKPLELIAADFTALNALIAQRLHSRVELVAQVAQYIIAAGGKRLRPALLLLISQALGLKNDPRALELAAVVEFIHTATLLHDDVVDESSLRRGRATANAAFGNAASVLVGDFLYSRAFQMMVAVGEPRVMAVLSEATNVIAEGEVLQLVNIGDVNLSVAQYMQVIEFKTAKLFEAAAMLPAVIAQQGAAVEAALAQFGRKLGSAFQIIDDVLDYEGNASELGKNAGDDLREGKMTLPLILALQSADSNTQARLKAALANAPQADEPTFKALLLEVNDLVKQSGAANAARTAAAKLADEAVNTLSILPASNAKNALIELTVQGLLRTT